MTTLMAHAGKQRSFTSIFYSRLTHDIEHMYILYILDLIIYISIYIIYKISNFEVQFCVQNGFALFKILYIHIY